MRTLDNVLYRIWRVAFFPAAMLGLFVVAGFRGALAIFCCGLILYALRHVPSP